ncbi:hypothetical protein [Neisseria bergeri]|nr:hypothetical protein [Neisseria bergeri]
MGKCRLKGFRRHFCLWALGKMSLEKNIANLKKPVSLFLLSYVILLKVRIWKPKNNRNLSETTKPIRRHPHESGNLEMKNDGNLSEMTEIQKTGFPPARE